MSRFPASAVRAATSVNGAEKERLLLFEPAVGLGSERAASPLGRRSACRRIFRDVPYGSSEIRNSASGHALTVRDRKQIAGGNFGRRKW